MATNYDDHTKNFSFILKQKGRWGLAPAYDVCFSYAPDNIWVSQHTLSINGKHKDINEVDLMALADANNIRNGDKIVKEITEIVSNWGDYAEKAGVSSELRDYIRKNLAVLRF